MSNNNSQLPPRPQPLAPRANEPQRDIPITNKTASQGFGQALAPGTRAPPGQFKAKYANSRNSGGKRRRTKTTKKRRSSRMRKSRRHR